MAEDARAKGWKAAGRVLEVMQEEAQEGLPPWFFKMDQVAKVAGVPTPPRSELMRVLKERGYLVSRSHVEVTAIKTDCPLVEVLEIARKVAKVEPTE
ncbi:hypothetical protein CLOM_g18592 [Closterium sp. NIES-68]|nr:hypothetical protein CLOM_g18592 [Closterium sp. NIES-68]